MEQSKIKVEVEHILSDISNTKKWVIKPTETIGFPIIGFGKTF